MSILRGASELALALRSPALAGQVAGSTTAGKLRDSLTRELTLSTFAYTTPAAHAHYAILLVT